MKPWVETEYMNYEIMLRKKRWLQNIFYSICLGVNHLYVAFPRLVGSWRVVMMWCDLLLPSTSSPHQVGGLMLVVSPTSMGFTTLWVTTSGNSTASNGTTSEAPATPCAPPPWWCDPMTSNLQAQDPPMLLWSQHLCNILFSWCQSEVVGPNT